MPKSYEFSQIISLRVYTDDTELLVSYPYLLKKQDHQPCFILRLDNLIDVHIYDYSRYMVFLNFKVGNLSDHIDEVGLFTREKNYRDSLDFSNEPKLDIQLPEHYTGRVFIAYSQPTDDGALPEKTAGSTMLKVNPNGLLRTSAPEDPVVFARRNEVFRYAASGQELPVLYAGFSRSDQANIPSIKAEDICVLSLGFNQFDRSSSLNKKFGREIRGNVGCYLVDTYANLVKKDRDREWFR